MSGERNLKASIGLHIGNIVILARDLTSARMGGHDITPVLDIMESEIRALRSQLAASRALGDKP